MFPSQPARAEGSRTSLGQIALTPLDGNVRIILFVFVIAFTLQLNSQEVVASATFWKSRGHCLPLFPPVLAFVFIVHWAHSGHSHFSAFYARRFASDWTVNSLSPRCPLVNFTREKAPASTSMGDQGYGRERDTPNFHSRVKAKKGYTSFWHSVRLGIHDLDVSRGNNHLLILHSVRDADCI